MSQDSAASNETLGGPGYEALYLCSKSWTTSRNAFKELYVRLTNSSDLFFLQTLTLSEDDFQCLKSQQGLLVDFSAFPQKFIDLLELCISEQNNSVPKFVLHFTSTAHSNGTLEIVEANPFKHLIHLSLKFVRGCDEEIKTYLADCLKKITTFRPLRAIKEENKSVISLIKNGSEGSQKNMSEEKLNVEQQLKTTEHELSSRLSTTQQILSDRTRQLEELTSQSQSEITKNKTHHQEVINREKENQAKLQHSYEERLQRERLTFEERYNKSVHELENRLRQTQSSNKELTDQKYKYESLIRELKSRVTSLEEERTITSSDLQQLRRQNTNLDSDRHERDKTLNHLRTRVAVLEQELKDKEQVTLRNNELLETANEHKQRLDSDLESKCQHIKQLENTIRTISADVIKKKLSAQHVYVTAQQWSVITLEERHFRAQHSEMYLLQVDNQPLFRPLLSKKGPSLDVDVKNQGNEIIHKLQTEIKGLKSKVKMANIVTTKQERLIEERGAMLSEKEKHIETQKDKITELQQQISNLTKNNEETSQKLNESLETLKNNENVINWLNKQLNEQTMTRLSSTQQHDMTTISSNNNNTARIAYTGRPTANATRHSYLSSTTQNFNPRLSNVNMLSNQRLPYRPTSHHSTNPRTAFQPRGQQQEKGTSQDVDVKNQMTYRPILKKPQFQPDGISPIVPQQIVRNPLRLKQMSTPVIREEEGGAGGEVLLDPKYLMRKKPEHMASVNVSNTNTHDENTDPNVLKNGEMKTNGPKPFVMDSSYFPVRQSVP